MNKKTHSVIMLTLLSISMLTLTFNIQTTKAEPKTWYVDDSGGADFTEIQDAIDVAEPGDTIYVYNGTYHEHLSLEKAVSLIGESKEATIIDGDKLGTPLRILSNDVTINELTFCNSNYIGIHVFHASGVVVSQTLVMSNDLYGVIFEDSFNCSVLGSTIKDNGNDGIGLWRSNHNTVKQNIVMENFEEGIRVSTSNNTTIKGNIVSNNKMSGIFVLRSKFCRIIENLCVNNTKGIHLHNSSRNTLARNTLSSNQYGMELDAVWFLGITTTSRNMVCENELSNSLVSIHLINTTNNDFYHNNVMESVYYPVATPVNGWAEDNWDDGYPSGGNYWDDQYHGECADHFNGPSQDIPGSDGIVDTPYIIDENNQDNYPLMEPWAPTPPIPTTIGELKTKIEELGSEDEIDNQGIVKSLLAKLNVAQKLVDKGKIDQAKSILKEDFIPQVQNLTDIHITPEAAELLIESAEYIISHL